MFGNVFIAIAVHPAGSRGRCGNPKHMTRIIQNNKKKMAEIKQATKLDVTLYRNQKLYLGLCSKKMSERHLHTPLTMKKPKINNGPNLGRSLSVAVH